MDLFIFGVAPLVVMQSKLLGEIGSNALVYHGNSYLRSRSRCRGEDLHINITEFRATSPLLDSRDYVSPYLVLQFFRGVILLRLP